MKEMINAYRILIGKPDGRDYLGALGIHGWNLLTS
jgi:hypothetical protein